MKWGNLYIKEQYKEISKKSKDGKCHSTGQKWGPKTGQKLKLLSLTLPWYNFVLGTSYLKYPFNFRLDIYSLSLSHSCLSSLLSTTSLFPLISLSFLSMSSLSPLFINFYNIVYIISNHNIYIYNLFLALIS